MLTTENKENLCQEQGCVLANIPKSRPIRGFGFMIDPHQHGDGGRRPLQAIPSGWGREGSNLRMTESKSVALPLGYAPAIENAPALDSIIAGNASAIRAILPPYNSDWFPL
jgi:hypothetical protein